MAPPAGRRDALFCPRQSACVHNTSPVAVSLAHCNLIKGGGEGGGGAGQRKC